MLEKIIQRFFGKKNFHIDESVPVVYVFEISFKYMVSLLRGSWHKLFLGQSGHHLFIEKGVKLINQKKYF